MKCHVLDVGQAATVVLEFGDGVYGIVDCGGTRGRQGAPIVDFLMAELQQHPKLRIAFLLISHLDLDHVSGLSCLVAEDDLTDRIEHIYCNQLLYRQTLSCARRIIKNKIGSGIASNPRNSAGLKSLRILGDLASFIKNKSNERKNFHFECVAPEIGHPDIYPVRLGIDVGRSDIYFALWCPTQRLHDEGFEELDLDDDDLLRTLFGARDSDKWNTASIVLTVEIAGTRFLLAGDSTSRTWKEIFDQSNDGWDGADVVVAWHHGGRLGIREGVDFDRKVWESTLTRKRKVVAISCGSNNNYGHPHKDTIHNVSRVGGTIYCTEKNKRDTRFSKSRSNADSVALQLEAVAKSIWLQPREQPCCGDIMIQAETSGELNVICSNSLLGERIHVSSCCFDPNLQQLS